MSQYEELGIRGVAESTPMEPANRVMSPAGKPRKPKLQAAEHVGYLEPAVAGRRGTSSEESPYALVNAVDYCPLDAVTSSPVAAYATVEQRERVMSANVDPLVGYKNLAPLKGDYAEPETVEVKPHFDALFDDITEKASSYRQQQAAARQAVSAGLESGDLLFLKDSAPPVPNAVMITPIYSSATESSAPSRSVSVVLQRKVSQKYVNLTGATSTEPSSVMETALGTYREPVFKDSDEHEHGDFGFASTAEARDVADDVEQGAEFSHYRNLREYQPEEVDWAEPVVRKRGETVI